MGLGAVGSLAGGTPVVASRVGGLSTILRDGDNGALIPWRHPRLFADKIRPILNDAGLRRRLSRNGLATARRYSWGGVAERTADVYDAVLHRSAVGRASGVE